MNDSEQFEIRKVVGRDWLKVLIFLFIQTTAVTYGVAVIHKDISHIKESQSSTVRKTKEMKEEVDRKIEALQAEVRQNLSRADQKFQRLLELVYDKKST